MIKFSIGIPVTIHPLFWVMAIFIGFMGSGGFLIGTIIWSVVITLSVLIHEMGHALTALYFGKKPKIDLVALGGLTYYGGGRDLSKLKNFFVTFNGPLFGLILYGISKFLFPMVAPSNVILGYALKVSMNVNFYWTILNLLPIIPLDGGQLSRIILESFFDIKGTKYSYLVSSSIALLLSLWFIWIHEYFMSAFFSIFFFQNYESWRAIRKLSKEDKNARIRQELVKAEKLLNAKDTDEALKILENINSRTSDGMIHTLVVQQLAEIYYQRAELKKVYDLLKNLSEDDLQGKSPFFLQEAAFVEGDYDKALTLTARCFQENPSAEIAVRGACSAAILNKVEATIGWLESAIQAGLENPKDLIESHYFSKIKQNSEFQEFTRSLGLPKI